MNLAALRDGSVSQLLNVAVPVLLTVLTVIQLVASEPPGNVALVTAFALASVLPLALRRRAPLVVTAVVAVAVVGQTVAGAGSPATFASFLAAMICVFTLARHTRPIEVVLGITLVIAAAAITAVLQVAQVPFEPFEVVYPLVYFGGACALGAVLRQRALRMAAVEDRAAALAGELEREAALAAAQERARIARELHDVVAHGISLMVVQAEAAEEVLTRDPMAAVAPLRRVQNSGREALGEMRRMLGVLRAQDTDDPSTAPQPSLRAMDELIADAAGGGLRVSLDVHGEPVALPLGVQLAAYRIVQEALTNTRRHAGATCVRVGLCYQGPVLCIEVVDDGCGVTDLRMGHGLIGMRERAALYGGTLAAGPAPGGGFRVAATLPYEAPA